MLRRLVVLGAALAMSAGCQKQAAPTAASSATAVSAVPSPSVSTSGAPSTSMSTSSSTSADGGIQAVALPSGERGIGFDDLRFVRAQKKVLAPAGCTGKIGVIDADNGALSSIDGFKKTHCNPQGHDDGATSADGSATRTFVTDRTAQALVMLDPSSATLGAPVPLKAGPDYVRWVEPTSEVWVTEPDAKQIEVFRVAGAAASTAATIAVPDGPESLIIDVTRGRAYTHEWSGTTLALDLHGRSVVGQWPNTCSGSRGIALDEAHGWLFAGCAEGKAVVLDAAHEGKVIASLDAGVQGVDVIDYSPKLGHLYLPGSKSATMAVIGVKSDGQLAVLGTVPTARGAHCVAADDHGRAWVCDPMKGRLLRYDDPYPPSH